MNPRDSDTTDKRQSLPQLFKPGQSGNPKGRPKGSRHKLAQAFIADLFSLWQEDGIELMRRAAAKNPVEMVKVVASLVPKDVNLNHEVSADFRSLWETLATGKVKPIVDIEAEPVDA